MQNSWLRNYWKRLPICRTRPIRNALIGKLFIVKRGLIITDLSSYQLTIETNEAKLSEINHYHLSTYK